MDFTAFEILSERYPEKITFLSSDDPFHFLIMVMLSAQTTDKRVMEVSPELFRRYPDARALAAARQEEVEEIIRPLGFFRSKAASIIATSRRITELGYIPDTIEELIKLPGVGRKSANCYIGEVLKKGAVIVDTHFRRVAWRLGYTDSQDPAVIESDIRKKLPEDKWYRCSMVLNAFGRDICHSRNPECSACPVSAYCRRV